MVSVLPALLSPPIDGDGALAAPAPTGGAKECCRGVRAGGACALPCMDAPLVDVAAPDIPPEGPGAGLGDNVPGRFAVLFSTVA